MKPRLDELVRYVHVSLEDAKRPLDYSCFTYLVGAVLTCYGRPSTHVWEGQTLTEDEEEDKTEREGVPGYVVGNVVWEPRKP